MKKSNKNHILARYLLVICAMLMFASVISYDLFKTSVVYAGQWNNKADSILSITTPIEPERGKLLADNGTVLAANLHFYVVRIDWKSAGINEDTLKTYLPALCDSLHAFDPSKTAAQWKKDLLDAKAKGKRSYRLFQNLSFAEYNRLRTFPYFKKKLNQTGLYTELKMKRCKPYGSMASRSIGNVGENERNKSIHGHSGLEMALDSLLYGIPGKAQRIQLTSNIANWESVPAVKGYDVTTTINVPLQDIVETELYNQCHETNARWGTAVLMEVATGEIKAISNLEWNDKAQDYVEGRNNAVLGYEPGSVMKPISMMIALEDGIISDIDAPIATGTSFLYGGRYIKDPHGGASLTPRQIIATSSNVGMSKIILRKYESDPGKFYDRLKGMGFFEPFHSGIAGEQVPQMRRLGRTTADRVALTRQSFGYSSLIPPLSILAMYNAIANNGRYVCPHLFNKLSREGQPDSIIPIRYIRNQVCSPENAAKLRIMLHDVVWSDRGTAHHTMQDDKVEIAGKTGTAFTIDANGKYGTQKRLAFCGFFPYSHPKYSCVVLMLGADRGAAASSGMVLKNVALKMYARGLLGEQPKLAKSQENAVVSPTLYASCSRTHSAYIKRSLNLSSVKTFAVPQRGRNGGVPNVIGLNVRDAISRLENAGLCVRFSDAGYVVSQSLAAGSSYRRGQVINLRLHH